MLIKFCYREITSGVQTALFEDVLPNVASLARLVESLNESYQCPRCNFELISNVPNVDSLIQKQFRFSTLIDIERWLPT